MNEDGFDLRGILPMRDGAPPSELVVRSLRGDPEPLLEWQRGRIAELESEVERLRNAEAALNTLRGLPLLTNGSSETAALTYSEGLWEVVVMAEPFWASPWGRGNTPEAALREVLDEMLEMLE